MSISPLWQPPSIEKIKAGVEELRKRHPSTVTLTIPLKLRTTRFKEQMLRVTQQRVTDMKSEVLETFHRDLDQINSGLAGEKLIDAVVMLCHSDDQSMSMSEEQHLRQSMASMVRQFDPLNLPVALTQTVTGKDDAGHGVLTLLRAFLDHWHTKNPDKHLSNTLDRAAEAKKRTSDSDAKPRYNPEQIEQIKYAILLRKALQSKYADLLQTCRVAAIAEAAELHCRDTETVQKFDEDIRKRSAGQVSESIINVICASLRNSKVAEGISDVQIDLLRDTLYDLLNTIKRRRGSKQPFIREIIRVLADEDSECVVDNGMRQFCDCLNHWYATRNEQQKRFLQEKFQGEHEPHIALRIRYAVLLYAYLEEACTLSTDVLVLVELAEAVIRQLGDGLGSV